MISPWSTKRNHSLTQIQINIDGTKYKVIKDSAKALGWVTTPDDENWDVLWTDSGMQVAARVKRAKRFQRINHFPGMVQLYRKGHLARAMNKMMKISDAMEYNFVPQTWLLPGDLPAVKRYFADNPNGCLIVKPTASAQGKGIYITLNVADILLNHDSVAQSYVMNPLLIDGFKFDLRIYVLVICCDPLRVLIYKEGLVRLCTARYDNPTIDNLDISFMHLTNYAVNKTNKEFVENNSDESDSSSSKRSLEWLWSWLSEQGHNTSSIWSKISDIVVKTLISVQASLAYSYRSAKSDQLNMTPFSCFEVLGFDIILKDDLEPVLLEVNHAPSFRTDSKLDERVKSSLIKDTFALLNVNIEDRKRYFAERAVEAQIRLYGSKFNELAGDTADRPVIKHTSERTLWLNYLRKEKENLGSWQLVYPTCDYVDQPTFGKQDLYESFLRLADGLFRRGIGAVEIAIVI